MVSKMIEKFKISEVVKKIETSRHLLEESEKKFFYLENKVKAV